MVLRGYTTFSKLDLEKAYHQITVVSQDVLKNAIVTPFGLFEFTCMSFGLENAAKNFQRFFDVILRGLPFVFAYVDDILGAIATPSAHLRHLRLLIERLTEHGLIINGAKCESDGLSLEFLGHFVNASGIRPLSPKVTEIIKLPHPESPRQPRRFLGLVNYY